MYNRLKNRLGENPRAAASSAPGSAPASAQRGTLAPGSLPSGMRDNPTARLNAGPAPATRPVVGMPIVNPVGIGNRVGGGGQPPMGGGGQPSMGAPRAPTAPAVGRSAPSMASSLAGVGARMKKGGSVKSRDGIAKRGKTKGRMC